MGEIVPLFSPPRLPGRATLTSDPLIKLVAKLVLVADLPIEEQRGTLREVGAELMAIALRGAWRPDGIS